MNKNKIYLILIFFVFGNLLIAQNHNIKVRINGLQDTSLILGHYFNKKMLVNDTIKLDNKGEGVFKGDSLLHGGVYVIYMPDKTYFDIIIDDKQDFSFTVDKEKPIESMVIKGNPQQKIFNDYTKFIVDLQKKAKILQDSIKNNPKGKSVKQWKTKLTEYGKQVDERQKKIISDNKGTFLSSFLTALRDVEIPKFDNMNLPDSVINRKRYNYYKNHYFDNIDLSDNRMLYTPFLSNKLETYFNKVILQIPDSVVKQSVKVVELAKGDKEMEKYLIQYVFNNANESKIMGMDAALVQIAEKYYLNGKAYWVDSKFMDKLEDRVRKIKPTIIGNVAHDLKLYSANNEGYKLSEIYAPITILIFWEPNCGHCKKEIPKLKELVWDKYRDKGVKIFAVYTQVDKKEWTDFVTEKQVDEWINVYDPYNQSNFRELFDIYSTPTIYILTNWS